MNLAISRWFANTGSASFHKRFLEVRSQSDPLGGMAKKAATEGKAKKRAAKAETLLDALHAIRGAGRFHSTGTRPFAFPGLRLPDGEELSFPLPASQARAIKSQGEPAPYGKGTKTVHDESVRKSCPSVAPAS